MIYGYEYGNVEEYDYHEVYSDGNYIYDPRYSNEPVLKQDYFKMLREINPDGFNVFEKRNGVINGKTSRNYIRSYGC